MQAPFNNIVQHLFHQPSLQSVTVDELESMALQHPYFAAAHFLLLKKMLDTDHPLVDSQLHKTSLYFNNPLWLQFLLQPETVEQFSITKNSSIITDPSGIPPAQLEEDNLQTQDLHTAASIAGTGEILHTAPLQPEAMVAQPETTTDSAAASVGMMDVITALFNQDAPATAETTETTVPVHTQKHIQPAAIQDAVEASATFIHQENVSTPIPQETWLPDTLVTVVNEQATNAGTFNDLPPVEEIGAPAAEMGNQKEALFNPAEEEMAIENAEEADATDAPQTESSIAEKPLLKTIIETAAAHTDTLFEPFHTVDYFASQGIKLSKLEGEPKDKLGRQLKSFTEWLKTMKRLPQVSIDKILSENEESKVVADAIHSIENKEVITEAMAEVFEKQGMNEKAVEVYLKLSLLNPAKSTYFAAKIAILKN